ncbi:conserved hypothetical protein [Vibrio chagasii]|nr:conserved hypothetical protein [Vibrio chagasii]CAH7166561.1 conserved hypothetical protein [Vibrio chagasii]CAH7244121.1 conserved hypothetical protein [Vibrio chagasii]CAH7359741.1 conserved hypothetical protein [Vibrio chagasii]
MDCPPLIKPIKFVLIGFFVLLNIPIVSLLISLLSINNSSHGLRSKYGFNMNKIYSLALICFPFSVQADWQDVADYVGDTFNISISKENYLEQNNDNDLTYTLYGSHNFNDTWRVFGQYDSDLFGELGIGYSFILADLIYNEVTVAAGGNLDDVEVYKSGLFSAFAWEGAVFYTDFTVQYIDRELHHLRAESISLDKTLGSFYEVNDWLSLSLSYTHQMTHYKKWTPHLEKLPVCQPHCYGDNSYSHYLSPGITISIFGVKPTVSYNYYFDNSDYNSIDFNLTFDF